MTPRLLDVLCCPDDGSYPLMPRGDGLACPGCGRFFPVEEEIPSLLPAPGAAAAADAEAVAAERRRRDEEAERYDRLPGLRLLSLAEIPAALGPLRVRAGQRVVEAGCGTGRFTVRLAAAGPALVAVDHSLASLRVLARKLGSLRAGALLVQGDVSRLPVRSGWADTALSCQVLEHLPSTEMRGRAVAELSRTLASGGLLAVSAYWHAPGLRRILPREGRHGGAIYFHRFETREFRRMLEPYFHIDRLTGRLVYILLAHCRKRAEPI